MQKYKKHFVLQPEKTTKLSFCTILFIILFYSTTKFA